MILTQLKNNIVDQFNPPEYKIAWRLHIDEYSEKEVIELLNSLPELPQYIQVRIHNAFRDINTNPDVYENYGVWENEQLYKLKMKRKHELQNNK